jgi:CubicO group peptidase (beta-lactamase class C family)
MKSFPKLTITLMLVIIAISGYSQSLIKSESAGLSAKRLEILSNVLDEYVENKEVAGGVALIARDGQIGYLKPFGTRDIESNDNMEADDIFRIASMTKAVTVVGIMTLFEDGLFTLDEPISKYISEFANMNVMVPDSSGNSYTLEKANTPITFRHLLNHTSGLTYDFFGQQHISNMYQQRGIHNGLGASKGNIGEMVKRLAELPLMNHPGEKWQYGMNMDVLGYLIEVISGKTLEQYFQSEIFEPLAMNDTYFYLPDSKKDRIASLYGITSKGVMTPIESVYEYHSDLKTHQLNRSYFSGGGGLVSTAEDYYKFLQMLLNNGAYKEKKILSRKTVELITSEQTGDNFPWFKGHGFGFGFAISRGAQFTGSIGSNGTYSWLGYFNSYYWVDPQENLIGILLTQMKPENTDIEEKFKNLMYQSLKE